MTRRFLSVSMVMALTLSVSTAVYASPFHLHAPVHAKMGLAKIKLIRVNLRNDSKAPMKITAGSTSMTIAPGETTTANLSNGDKIVANEGCTEPAGTVLDVVAPGMADATIRLR